MVENDEEHEKAGASAGGAISVGGDVTGSALASGQHITATVTFGGPDAEERKRVLEALATIHAEMTKLSGPEAPMAKATAGAAVEAAKKERPNKDEIGSLLDIALKAAREGAEYAALAAKLAPYVRTAAGWLGGQWKSLIDLLA